jgi:hypothetical protein
VGMTSTCLSVEATLNTYGHIAVKEYDDFKSYTFNSEIRILFFILIVGFFCYVRKNYLTGMAKKMFKRTKIRWLFSPRSTF